MVQQQSNTPQPDFLGQQFGGYRLVQPLGRGGFAQVYKGEHVQNKHVAAIKVFITSINNQIIIPNDQTKAELMNEAIIHSKLIHPHILKIFRWGTQHGLPSFPQGVPFLVLEWAPGGALFHYYEKQLPLVPSVVVNLVNQIADGLQYAHDHNVLHRDLKPLNLLFNANQQVLLADFGIARFLDQDNSYHVTQHPVKGTLSYMSPEQIRGKTNKASDQYSLGVIAYEWLTGKKPFYGDDQVQMINHHLYDLPPPLRQVVPTLSPAIENVVLRTLEKETDKRFPSVADFAKALEIAVAPAAAQQPRVVPPPPPKPTPLNSQEWTWNQPAAPPPSSGPVGQAPPPPGNAQQPPTAPPSYTIPNPIVRLGTAVAHFALPARTKEMYWLPNSARLAAASVDNQLSLWDTSGVEKDVSSKHREGKWSPDYQYSAYLVQGGVEVYDILHQRLAQTYHGQTEITAIAWSPNGQSIASVGKEANEQSIHVWSTLTGQLIYKSRPHVGPIEKVSLLTWSPDGRSLASTDESATVTIWDANALSIACDLPPPDPMADEVPTELCWSATGRYLAIGLSGQVRVWDVWKTIDEAYRQISQGTSADAKSYPTYGQDRQMMLWCPQVDFQPQSYRQAENSFLALLTDSNSVTVLDVSTGDQVSHHTADASIRALIWSPDGKALAVGGEQGMIEIWDAWTEKKLKRIQPGTRPEEYQTHALAWSPDGQYLASSGGTLAGRDYQIRLWHVQNITAPIHSEPQFQSPFVKFLKNLDASGWIALFLGLLDLIVPPLVGIITLFLPALFFAPILALVAFAITAISLSDNKQATGSDNNLAFNWILAFFTSVWAITFLAIGFGATGGAIGGVIIGGVGAILGWFVQRPLLRAFYRAKRPPRASNSTSWWG